MQTKRLGLPAGSARSAGFLRLRLVALTGFCLIPSVLVLAVASFLTVSSTTAALRNSVLETNPGQKRVAVSAGPVTCAVAKYGLGFLDLPPEARLGIASARGGEACVYQLDRAAGPAERGRIIRRADIVMEKRGYSRVIGVVRQADLVAVYMPANQRSKSEIRACVLVLHERDLVVAAGRAKIEPILELAAMHCNMRELPLLVDSR